MAADKRGGNKTVRDLVLSMLVLGVVVYLIYLFIPHDSKADPVKTETVGYSVELQQARRDAPYPVAGPEGLGAKWRATSVTYSGSDRKNVTWHIGFVDPDQQYAAVEQTNGNAAAFIAQVTLNGHRDGDRTLPVHGVGWTYYTGGRYHAVAREQNGVTTVVLGTGPDSRLQQLAGALKS
ncbi:DUF4245 domain-containing protein [Actinacidiphila yanglinensis]|uniref:DUF4245 domain-containing protein n=1 Tax=Actinacidiphila yanglinensis TaxID=310779 RepID=UPI001F3B9758|nr:DUF4245 domain-containing protein [Actinacidiphila yanglinensis]